MNKSYPLRIKRASSFLKNSSYWLLRAVYLQLNRVAEERAGIGVKARGVRA